MKNLLVMQSGGPTAVINASLCGVIKKAKEDENIDKVYGSINGVNGLIKGEFVDLTKLIDDELELLKVTPAAYLGSTRHNLASEYLDYKYNINGDYTSIYTNAKEYNIGYIIVIGGNDSMDTVHKLSTFFEGVKLDIKIIGVPKTIDNDLVLTDHAPGYGSAVKYIASSISEIKLDTSVYAKGRVTIVEIMGRDAGWLTAGSKLASLNGLGPDLIYLPETPFVMHKFLEDVKRVYESKNQVLVAVSEGIKNENGRYIISSYSYNQINDVFGHQQLGGTSTVLAQIVKDTLGIPVRSLELNIIQRCASAYISKVDMDEAYELGRFAVSKVINESGKFVIMNRVSNDDYKIEYDLVDVSEVANKVKTVPTEWIINGNDVSEEYIKYALPLIKGEVKHEMENELPKFIKR